jgi:hypothetical protein
LSGSQKLILEDVTAQSTGQLSCTGSHKIGVVVQSLSVKMEKKDSEGSFTKKKHWFRSEEVANTGFMGLPFQAYCCTLGRASSKKLFELQSAAGVEALSRSTCASWYPNGVWNVTCLFQAFGSFWVSWFVSGNSR